MKYSISDTNKLYKEYENIRALYCGEKTNWRECIEKYQILEFKIRKVRPMSNKFEDLNIFILTKLRQDVIHEINRLSKKLLDDME